MKVYCCFGAYYDVGCDDKCPSKIAPRPGLTPAEHIELLAKAVERASPHPDDGMAYLAAAAAALRHMAMKDRS
jgi:hypothetical protein